MEYTLELERFEISGVSLQNLKERAESIEGVVITGDDKRLVLEKTYRALPVRYRDISEELLRERSNDLIGGLAAIPAPVSATVKIKRFFGMRYGVFDLTVRYDCRPIDQALQVTAYQVCNGRSPMETYEDFYGYGGDDDISFGMAIMRHGRWAEFRRDERRQIEIGQAMLKQVKKELFVC